jgi:Domain of unknown function (DUF4421)
MMMVRVGYILIVILFNQFFGFAQTDLVSLADADSNYVRKHTLPNDIRLFYGLQGDNISLGSKNEGDPNLNGNVYTNTNDYVGMGITYKWLDGDLSFSLPGTTYLNEERSNLTKFKLAMSYTLRKIALRGYFQDSKGVVVSGTENEFQTTPSLHERKIGLQITYLFNALRYSYRASLYQSEFQMKTAGSFMVRVEPFYRNLGGQRESMIPAAYDVVTRYGDQVGLEYIKAPGVLVMPGYGINFVMPNSRLFISPMIFAGVGAAHNTYQSKNGKSTYTNVEYAANFNLNMGYNGSRFYSKIQFQWMAGYAPLNPSYFTSTSLTLSLWVGFRFRDIENFIPRSF